MKLESKLVLASKNAITGVPLYTFVLTYPRVILAEVNTHRMLSRNTASSRAIPSKKQRERVMQNPFIPISIGQNQKGMQAGKELSGWRRIVAYKTWEYARYPMVLASWILDKLGAHKQVVNRIVEPWTFTQQIVTATDWRNVFKLRNHTDAEPHFHVLAAQMQAQVEFVEKWFNVLSWDGPTQIDRRLDMDNSIGVGTMQVLQPGEWHLPFVDTDELKHLSGCDCIAIATHNQQATEILNQVSAALTISAGEVSGLVEKPQDDALQTLKQVSAARCARVSYMLPENGKRSDINRDIELCKRLSESGHWSPFEHAATPVETNDYIGNFRAWKQYRKEFTQEDGGDRQ